MLAIIGIIYGALVAMVQPNMKKLVAYSSVSHLGFVVLGIFSFTQMGIDGAVYQMLNHGISTGALFMLVGMLYERRHSSTSRNTAAWRRRCRCTHILPVHHASSVGLPLLNNFVGEFLVLSGAFQAKQRLRHSRRHRRDLVRLLHALDVPARLLRRGRRKPVNETLRDLDTREQRCAVAAR